MKELAKQTEPVLRRILLRHPQGISEFELIKELKKNDVIDSGLLPGKSHNDFELFSAHFMLFHLLYLLRNIYLKKRKYVLSIHCLCIQLLPYSNSNSLGVEPRDKMADYYLDLSKLKNTGPDDVSKLLSQFWKQYAGYQHKEEFYNVLGLKAGADRQLIRKTYRELVKKHHPDHGGDTDRFIAIREAAKMLLS